MVPEIVDYYLCTEIMTGSGGMGMVAPNSDGVSRPAPTGQIQSIKTTVQRYYEIRRELLRARRTAGIARLNALITQIEYLAITTSAIRQAATFRAEDRQQGRPTATDPALHGYVILAAQVATLGRVRFS